jgi:hypothetical protein
MISTISVIDVNGKEVNYERISDNGNKSTIQLIGIQPGIHIIKSMCEDGSIIIGRILVVNK